MKKLIALLFVFATLTLTVGCGDKKSTASTGGGGSTSGAASGATGSTK